MALICHCEGVRDRTIVKAVQRGACTLADVQAATGAATRCGGCEPAVRAILERSLDQAPVRVRAAYGLTA
jgi:bacterioferritin-associated ferredoxin